MRYLPQMNHVQVFEVSSREWDVGNNLDLAITNRGDLDLVAEVASAALDLDALVQELLEGGEIEDLVANRLAAVDGVLTRYKPQCPRWIWMFSSRTFLVTLEPLVCLPFWLLFYISYNS